MPVSEILQEVGATYRYYGVQRRLTCPRGPSGGGGKIVVYVNGLVYPDREGDFFDTVKRMEVRAIEIYRTAIEMPRELSTIIDEDGKLQPVTCAVVVWTR